MPYLVIVLTACGVFGLLVLIQVIVKAPKPVQRAFGGVLTGLFALAAVDFTGFFTGVSLPLSPLAIGVSGAAGIPGVTLLLLLNLVFQ
ncbi:pro-sigmaK processing inhibitor BofA family protein [Caproiciproducens sp. LBM24188]